MKSFAKRFSCLSGRSRMIAASSAILSVVVLSFSKITAQTTRYVDPAGNCGGNSPCYTTIQAAINASVNGDIIEVFEGTYNHTTQLNVNKEVTLRSAYAFNTNRPVIRFTTYTSYTNCQMQIAAHNVVIDGFEIDGGGQASARYILGDYGSARNSWTVRNCKIYNGDNGMRIVGNNITIEDNDIRLTRGDCINGESGICGGLLVTCNVLRAESVDWARRPAGITYNVDASAVGDVEFSYNYVFACRTFIDFQHNGGTAPANNIVIKHNTVDWRMENLPSPVPASAPTQQMSIAFWTSGGKTWDASKFEIRDNIFSRQKWYMIVNTSGSGGPIVGNMEIKNNLFYQWYLVDAYFPSNQYPKEWPGVRGAVGWATTDDDFLFTDNILANPIYNSSGSTPQKYYALSCLSPARNAATDGTNIGAWQSQDATWVGAVDSEWSTPANWHDNAAPEASSSVIIPDVATNDPVITSNIEISCLTIEAGGQLTITSTGTLTVFNKLDNFGGVGGLVIKSGDSGTGSLIHSTDDVQGTVERYIPASGYHQVSVPISQLSNPTSLLFLWSHLYEFDVAGQTWVGLGSPTGTPLTVDKGYLIYKYPGPSRWEPDTTYAFNGEMNNGPFLCSMAFPDFSGNFNLVPNPYPSPIDWNVASGWTKTNLSGSYWMWIHSANNCGVWNGEAGTHGVTKDIPVGQAFFVQATAANPVLSMNNNARLHSSQAFYKEKEELSNLLRLNASFNNYSDELVVLFDADASPEYNDQEDATKMYGGTDAPQIYSLSDDEHKLTINMLPLTTEKLDIPVGFELNIEGEVSFTATSIDTFDPQVTIHLWDRLTDTMTNLRTTPEYTFYHHPDNPPERFDVLFNSAVGIDEPLSPEASIYFQDGWLYLNISEEIKGTSTVNLFNVNGQLVFSSQAQPGRSTIAGHGLGAGIYMVQLINKHFITIQKAINR